MNRSSIRSRRRIASDDEKIDIKFKTKNDVPIRKETVNYFEQSERCSTTLFAWPHAAVADRDGLRSLARLRADSLHRLDGILAADHLAEHDVLAIQVWRRDRRATNTTSE